MATANIKQSPDQVSLDADNGKGLIHCLMYFVEIQMLPCSLIQKDLLLCQE